MKTQWKQERIFFFSLSNCVLEHVFVWRDINDRQGSCRYTEPGGISTDPSLKYEGLREKKQKMCTKREICPAATHHIFPTMEKTCTIHTRRNKFPHKHNLISMCQACIRALHAHTLTLALNTQLNNFGYTNTRSYVRPM